MKTFVCLAVVLLLGLTGLSAVKTSKWSPVTEHVCVSEMARCYQAEGARAQWKQNGFKGSKVESPENGKQ